MKKLISINIFIFLLLFIQTSFSEEIISEINIQGLKRTKPELIYDMMEKYKGQEIGNKETQEIINKLHGTGLFSDIVPTVQGNTLNISLIEKFSITPIPFVFISTDNLGGGAILMDSNAWGIMDRTYAGGYINQEGWKILGSYRHLQKESAFLGWKASASLAKADTKIKDEDGDNLERYDNITTSVYGELNKRITPWLTASLSSGINISKVDDDTIDSELVIPAEFSLTAIESDWDGTFMDETGITASASYNFSFWNSDNYYTLSLLGFWQKYLIQRLRFAAHGGIFYAPDIPAVFAKNQNAISTALLSGSYRASFLAGGGAGLEWGIFKASWGVPSLYAQYQVCWADGIVSSDILAHGPVAGMKLYLSKFAFPAVDIYGAYNVNTGKIRFSAGAGVSL